MSAFAAISLLNNAAVEQVLSPSSIDSIGVAKWMSTSEASLDARRVASMSVSLPKNGSNVARIKQKVLIPIMDTVDTTKKIAEAYVTIEAVIPKQATETNRLDLRAYAKDLLADAVSTAAFTNLESIY